MSNHLPDFLRLASLLAVLAGLTSVDTLQADEKQAEAISTSGPLAEKHAKAVKNEKQRFANQDLQNRARRQHVKKAIEHLHAAGLHDLAKRIGKHVRNRIHDRERGEQRELNHEHRGRAYDDGHKHEHGTNGAIWRVISRLNQAIQNVERRVRDSDEIQRSVEDTHRNVQHMQREMELRFREIEQAVKHHVRDAERLVEVHSGEFEEVIEDIERHIERRIGELEERLDDLNEHFEHDVHGDDEDEDEEHEHHHHGDHEHDHDH